MLNFWKRIRTRSLADSDKDAAVLLLSNAAELLPSLMTRLGEPFCSFGEKLPLLSERSESLIAESDKLLALATGQQGSQAVLRETSELLEEPIRFLNAWRTEMSSHETALDQCAQLLANMLQAERKLQETISPLKHVQTMFKIEAAGLAEETRMIFAGLTEKIESVHKRVEDTFIRQFQIVAQSNSEVREVMNSVRTENARLYSMIQRHQSNLRASLEKLDNEIAENLNRDVQLRDVSKAVAEDVYVMVVALQSQDIVTQKLEHLAKAIEEIRALGLESAGPNLHLQSAHMRTAQAQMETTRGELAGAIQRIVSSVSCVDEKCLRLSEFDEVTAAADGTIQVLLETIANARTLTRSAMELAVRSGQRIRPVASTASSLIGALETLAFEMHLIALNAQIQAVQIGHGTGLEILAAHTANVSRITEELVRSVAADVERLAEGLGKVRAAFDHLGVEGQTHVEMLDGSGSEQEGKLHLLRDETLDKMRCVGDISDWIQAAAEDLERVIGRLDTVIPEMANFSSELERASSLCPGGGGTQDLAALNHMVASYTMHSERETHDQLAETSFAAEDEVSSEIELF